MKKIERLIAIVMILLEKETVSSKKLSHVFGVTPRTIQRDMDTLLYAGIPIFSRQGPTGGYSLMATYKFDKRLFNQQDIENMVIALSGFDRLIIDSEIQVTLEKIKSMSIHPPLIQLDFSFYEWSGRAEFYEEIIKIKHAISNQFTVGFEYIDRSGVPSLRHIEPYKLHYREQFWYLQGYDINKGAFRIFKITRMSHIRKKHPFSSRLEYVKLPELKKEMTSKQNDIVVKLSISPSIRDQFVERFGRDCISQTGNNNYLANILLPDNHYTYQYLLGFGNKIKIIEPQSFIFNFTNFLRETLDFYK